MPGRHSARGKRKSEVPVDSKVENKVAHLDVTNKPVPPLFSPKLEAIKQGFYLDSPDELVWFYQFCTSLDVRNPLDALMDTLELQLVGPFEVVHRDNLGQIKSGQFVRCHRYFHDPPELITLMAAPNGLHFGYFRDKPAEKPSAVVKSQPASGGELSLVAPNLFAAVKSLLAKKTTSTAQVLLKKLCSFATQHNINVDTTGHEQAERLALCVCPTLNNMGLVIKLREGDLGYRALSVSNAKLSALLKSMAAAQSEEAKLAKLEPIDQLVTYAQFACDEGDYGQSLELGLSLLSFKPKEIKPDQVSVLNSRIKHLLSVGYELAGRYEFSHVIREHMSDRRVDPIGMLWESE